MKGKAFLFIFISLLLTATILAISSSSVIRLKWVFNAPNGWTGGIFNWPTLVGNPGRVDFDSATGHINSSGAFSGNFWLGNVGWVTFNHGIGGEEAIIQCPNNILNLATQLCYISGAAWSENAGWIIFGSGAIGTGSGAYFDPNTASISGWWWNQALGWIPMRSGLSWSLAYDDLANTWSALWPISLYFVSKIAIVGNIAGTRVYSVSNSGITNQDVGYSYKTINHADILNLIRKNIALLTRNTNTWVLEDDTSVNPFNYVYRDKHLPNPDYDFPITWVLLDPNKRSIIIRWWDIILDSTGVNATNWSNPTIALIALKDELWNGWNIIVSKRVGKIYAYMYAEWSILSWEKIAWVIHNYVDWWPFNIPQGQLYIRGLAASKNTIGGAQQITNPFCPVLTDTLCDLPTAKRYDWDYFRNFDYSDVTQRSIPNPERSWIPKLDEAPMVIDYDEGILNDPPPWFRELK